jgi:hypothetical protein
MLAHDTRPFDHPFVTIGIDNAPVTRCESHALRAAVLNGDVVTEEIAPIRRRRLRRNERWANDNAYAFGRDI